MTNAGERQVSRTLQPGPTMESCHEKTDVMRARTAGVSDAASWRNHVLAQAIWRTLRPRPLRAIAVPRCGVPSVMTCATGQASVDCRSNARAASPPML